MADYHAVFNTQLLELMDDLIAILPNGNEFTAYKALLSGLIIVDKKAPQTVFNNTVVVPYKKYIDVCDETFFLNEDYSKTGVEQGLIDRLKHVWKFIDKENKDIVWKYIRNLTRLNALCMQ